jgi:hypothetical protein
VTPDNTVDLAQVPKARPGGLLLTADEVFELTGYRRASEQLAELQRHGFSRARRDRLGRLVLERAHYEAVCRGGGTSTAATTTPRPRVKHPQEQARRTKGNVK